MSVNFKTVAQNNDLDGFYNLWNQSNSLMVKLEALRWACGFDRAKMIDCVLDSKMLDATDLTVAFKEATVHKSLNAIGQLLHWCQWNNRFEQTHIGAPSAKYINEIGHTALMSDWSAVFVAHVDQFRSLSMMDRLQLYLRGVREGAVECLKVIDKGQSVSHWSDAFKTAFTALQSKSIRYLLQNFSLFDQKGCHAKAVNGLAELLADSYLFLHPQALECALTLMEFVTPQEVRSARPQFSQPRLSEVLDKVASMYEKRVLGQVVQDVVEQKDTQTIKRKI